MALTPQQIAEMDAAAGLDPNIISQMDADAGLAPQTQNAGPQATENQGFGERVQQNWQKRVQEGQEATDAYMAGEQSLPLTYLDYAGKIGVGTGLDLFNEGLKSAASYVPQGVKSAVSSGVHSLLDTRPGRDLVGASNYIGNQYQDLAGRFPNAARHIEAVANIGSFLAPAVPVKGASLANTALDAVSTGAGKTATGVKVATSGTKELAAKGLEKVPALDGYLGKTVRPTAEDLHKSSSAGYAGVAASEDILSPKFTNDLIDHAGSFKSKDEMAAAINGEHPLSDLSGKLENFRDQPMTLQRAMEVDQALTDKLEDAAFTDKNGVLNKHGRDLLLLKQKLRDNLMSAQEKGYLHINPDAKMQGYGSGAEKYRNAVKDWAAKSQMNEIQRIIDRASYMDNSATALKTGFRNIAVNPGRLSKFPKDVQAAIKQAARDGDLSNMLRTELGSRLISTVVGGAVGSAGGPLGTLAGAAAGMAGSRYSRAAAESMQMGRANKVLDAIAATSSLPTKTIPRSQLMRKKNLADYYKE